MMTKITQKQKKHTFCKEVCSTQKGGLNLNTSSKVGGIGFKELKRGPPNQSLRKSTNYTLLKTNSKKFKKESVSSLSGWIKTPCPFCLRSKVQKRGKKLDSNGLFKQKYKCLNCNKKWTISQYHGFRYPAYVVDEFIEILEKNPSLSTPQIEKILIEKTKYKITKGITKYWKRLYNKKKLYPYYLPNSRLNKINKPTNMKYIPNTNTKIKSYPQIIIDDSKVLERLKLYDNRAVSYKTLSSLISEEKKIPKGVCYGCIKRLKKLGFIEKIYADLYYINISKTSLNIPLDITNLEFKDRPDRRRFNNLKKALPKININQIRLWQLSKENREPYS